MSYKHATHLKKDIRLRDAFDIAATPSASAVARLWLRRTLQAWGARTAIDDMLVVGNELVTNAIQECRKANESEQWQLNLTSKLIRLRLLGFASTVAVEVWDRAPGEPRLPPADLKRTDGRGLLIVEALSMNWGFYPIRPWGKVVWAELSVADQQAVGT